MRLAISGKTGSGKSTVAGMLVDRYGFEHISIGSSCRKITELLFPQVTRERLNLVSDKLKEIDDNIFFDSAIAQARLENPTVLETIRFQRDFERAKFFGFEIIRVNILEEIRAKRVGARGDVYRGGTDSLHASETELDDFKFDFEIDNNGSPGELSRQIDSVVACLRAKQNGQTKGV